MMRLQTFPGGLFAAQNIRAARSAHFLSSRFFSLVCPIGASGQKTGISTGIS
jgi:hypothetical protein